MKGTGHTMKKTIALLLTLMLLFTLPACTALSGLIAPDPTPSPEPTAAPTAEPTATPEPTPEPTSEPKTEEIAAALDLYRTLFETGLTNVHDGIWELTDCDVLAADPATYSAYGDTLSWMEDFLLCDIDCDQIPELILETGQVERYIYIFKAIYGKIQFMTSCLSGNQEEINYAFSVYQTETGETQYYSIGVAGSGAGDLYFAYRILPDFSVEESFSHFKDPQGDQYKIDGANAQADDFETAYATHFDAMKLMEKLAFTSLGANPLASFDEAVHG